MAAFVSQFPTTRLPMVLWGTVFRTVAGSFSKVFASIGVQQDVEAVGHPVKGPVYIMP